MFSWIYTFSKADGSFEVIPYNYDNPNDNKIVYIIGSAVGAETFEKGQMWSEPYGWTDVQMNPANVGIINIARSDFQNTSYITGKTVAFGNTENFKGGMNLIVSNTTVYGASNFTAREDININSEFHAAFLSEVHIYPSETFPDCSDYTNFFTKRPNNFLATNDSFNNTFPREIEVQFKKNEVALDASIIPNPNTGLFTVQFNAEINDKPVQLKISNFLGGSMKEINTIGNNVKIDCSTFSKGIYFLEINIDKKIITKKLIIN